MSKPKFKVSKGLAFVITTGEPVYVQSIEGNNALITRPITTDEGIVHQEETFSLEQLETRHEQIKRNLEYSEYAEELKMEIEEKLYNLSNKPQASNPSKLASLFPVKTDA